MASLLRERARGRRRARRRARARRRHTASVVRRPRAPRGDAGGLRRTSSPTGSSTARAASRASSTGSKMPASSGACAPRTTGARFSSCSRTTGGDPGRRAASPPHVDRGALLPPPHRHRRRSAHPRAGEAQHARSPSSSGTHQLPDQGLTGATGRGEAAEQRVPRLRAAVLVEGVSDRIALETLAVRRGRDLAAEGVSVVAIGGAQAIGRVLEELSRRGAASPWQGSATPARSASFAAASSAPGSDRPAIGRRWSGSASTSASPTSRTS